MKKKFLLLLVAFLALGTLVAPASSATPGTRVGAAQVSASASLCGGGGILKLYGKVDINKGSTPGSYLILYDVWNPNEYKEPARPTIRKVMHGFTSFNQSSCDYVRDVDYVETATRCRGLKYTGTAGHSAWNYVEIPYGGKIGISNADPNHDILVQCK